MADALAAREHAVHELLGLELVAVALPADLEPLHRVPRGVLDAQHVDAAQRLVLRQHLRDVVGGVAVQLELPRELDRVFQRQLGARADGEVRRVHRVAHQHHVVRAVEVPPLFTRHALEVEPGAAPQVARVAHELFALQVAREKLFAEGDALVGAGLVQAVRQPDGLGAFDDEGAGAVVELVDVGLEPAVLGLLEDEGEGLVALLRAEPDEAVGPRDDVGLEDRRVLGADARVDAVAGDHEVGIGVVGVAVGLGLEDQLHAQFLAARLQDVEQLLAADAHEAVAAAADGAALELQLDVVPVREAALDGVGGLAVPLAHVVHGRVAEDHAPAEGVVGAVALDHADLVLHTALAPELLHQEAEIQARGAAADADDLHAEAFRR